MTVLAILSIVLLIMLVDRGMRLGFVGYFEKYPFNLATVALALFLVNLMCAFGSGRVGISQVVYLAYLTVPVSLAMLFRPQGSRRWWDGLLDLFIVCWLWIPNDFGLGLIFASWGGGMFGYALTAFTTMSLMIIIFAGFRKLNLGLDWSIGKRDWRFLLGMYLLLFLFIVPLAVKIGFIHPGLVKSPAKALIALVIWFAPALCEELIFRSVIQQAMIRWLRPFWGIAVASAVFGIAHIDNKAGIYSYPNWWYVLFATIAGAAYGFVYYKTKKLQCSATLHFLVDFTWVLFFKSGK